MGGGSWMLDNPLTSSIGFPWKEVCMPEAVSTALCIRGMGKGRKKLKGSAVSDDVLRVAGEMCYQTKRSEQVSKTWRLTSCEEARCVQGWEGLLCTPKNKKQSTRYISRPGKRAPPAPVYFWPMWERLAIWESGQSSPANCWCFPVAGDQCLCVFPRASASLINQS